MQPHQSVPNHATGTPNHPSHTTTYTPSNTHLPQARIITDFLDHPSHRNTWWESYSTCIKPGSSQAEVISRLPLHTNACIITYNKVTGTGGAYGHASCLKWVTNGNRTLYYHIDSDKQGPQLLSTPQDWAGIYGYIYTLQNHPSTCIDTTLMMACREGPI